MKKEDEKILKYKDLTVEIQRMWNVKTNLIPVIIGETGTISNNSENTWTTYRESTKWSNYRKQPYWALHTHCGKYWSKVKVPPYYRPWTPLRENRGIVLLFFVHLGTLDGGGWLAPRPGRLYPGKNPVPIVQEAGWVSEPVCRGAENLAPTGIRSPDLPARSQSLYWLSYPDCSSTNVKVQ